MELEELQNIWSEMSGQLEKQKKLTDKMIIMMTEEKYRNKINKIAYPELLGTIICYGTGIFILINFNKLDNWYTMLSGVFSLIVLFVLPVLSMRSIHRMRKVNIATNNYKETLLEYAKSKKQFTTMMKSGYYLGFILLFAIMPVSSKLLSNKDLFSGEKSIWPFVIAIPLAITFLVVFSKWVFKYYNSNIDSAQSLIKELEEADK